MNNIEIGERLKKLREQKGLKRLQLAKSIGASPALIKRWERNEHCPQLYFVVQMANLFGVSIDELIGRAK